MIVDQVDKLLHWKLSFKLSCMYAAVVECCEYFALSMTSNKYYDQNMQQKFALNLTS